MVGVSSGLPSHHHEEGTNGPIVADADHHGHGTLLVEQNERQTSQLLGLALPAAPAVTMIEAALLVSLPHVASSRLLATGRSPPSSRPRAPPVSV